MPRMSSPKKSRKNISGENSSLPVAAVICSDIHLRDDVPKCRTDEDYFQVQLNKVGIISSLAMSYDCPVLCAGDVFDFWKPSPWLLNQAIQKMKEAVWVAIPGQHDLPRHNLSLIEKSGIFNLDLAMRNFHLITNPFQTYRMARKEGEIDVWGFPWGMDLTMEKGGNLHPSEETDGRLRVAVVHKLCWKGKPPFPGAPEDGNEEVFFRTLPWADLIVTGDNHRDFVSHRDGRILVNPGAMMRMKADEGDREPAVYLWRPGALEEIEKVRIPVDPEAVSREHIERKKDRDDRIDAFVARLNQEYDVEVDFRENLKRHFETNRIPKLIRETVMDCVENP